MWIIFIWSVLNGGLCRDWCRMFEDGIVFVTVSEEYIASFHMYVGVGASCPAYFIVGLRKWFTFI